MANVAAVAIKLAPFWVHDPVLWFAQAEAQFHARNITVEATRYYHVVAALAPEVAAEVRDLLVAVPDDTPYTILKKALVQRVGVTEEVRLRRLLVTEQLGDRKPSQLLRHLQQLLGDATMSDEVLRHLFLERLPVGTRAPLAARRDVTDLTELATIADAVHTVTASVPSMVDAVDTPPAPECNSRSDDLAAMREAISALRRDFRSRRHLPRSAPDSQRNSSSTLCWYHATHGDKARKCREGCVHFSGNGAPTR